MIISSAHSSRKKMMCIIKLCNMMMLCVGCHFNKTQTHTNTHMHKLAGCYTHRERMIICELWARTLRGATTTTTSTPIIWHWARSFTTCGANVWILHVHTALSCCVYTWDLSCIFPMYVRTLRLYLHILMFIMHKHNIQKSIAPNPTHSLRLETMGAHIIHTQAFSFQFILTSVCATRSACVYK